MNTSLYRHVFEVVCLVLGATLSFAASAAESRRLTVGIPEGLPGYERLPEGGIRMADPYKLALTACIERRLDVQFQWVQLPTNRVLLMLSNNTVDLLYPMGFTEERAAALLESRATWENPDVWLSHKPVTLGNKEILIASKMGSPQHTEYVSQGYAKLKPVYTYEDLPRLLTKQAVDAVIVPRSVYLDRKNSWPKGTYVTPGKQRSSGFYMNKADPKGLLAPLNAAIERCIQTVPAS